MVSAISIIWGTETILTPLGLKDYVHINNNGHAQTTSTNGHLQINIGHPGMLWIQSMYSESPTNINNCSNPRLFSDLMKLTTVNENLSKQSRNVLFWRKSTQLIINSVLLPFSLACLISSRFVYLWYNFRAFLDMHPGLHCCSLLVWMTSTTANHLHTVGIQFYVCCRCHLRDLCIMWTGWCQDTTLWNSKSEGNRIRCCSLQV